MSALLRTLCLLILLPNVCLAQTPISGMPDGGPMQQGDTVPVVRGGVNFKTQFGATSTGAAGDVAISNGTGGFGSFSMSGASLPTPLYNNLGSLAALTTRTWLTVANTVNEYFQAAALLYFISQGMDIDPRLNGASANGIFFGSAYGANNPITTTSGSTHITASGYLFKQGTACASASCTGDVGKRMCINGKGGHDVGPCSCIATVNIDGSAELSVAAWNSTTDGQAVMAGYATNPSDPTTCADDTIPIQNSSSIQAIYHGGAVKLPPRSTFHNLRMQQGTWLKGNGGGNYYPSPGTFPLAGLPFGTPSMPDIVYCGATGYNTDSETCIDASSGSGLRFSDFFLQGIVFPYPGFNGLTLVGIGVGQTGTSNDAEQTLVEHVSFTQLPVDIGTAFSYDWPITVTGSIAPGPGSQGTLTVTAVTSNLLATNYPEIGAYGITDYPAVNRKFTGTGVPANETIVKALQAGTTGTYIVSLSATTTSETMTFTAGGGMSGSYRYNQFGPSMIGMNGTFVDMNEIGGIYTGDFFQYGWYLHGGSEVRKVGGRFEEIQGSAVYINATGDVRFDGTHWQNNIGANITLAGCCAGGLQVTGGGMEGGGTGARAQLAMIEATGSYYSANVSGVNLQPHGAKYLYKTTTGAGQFGIGPFSVDGGNGDAEYPWGSSGPFTNLADLTLGINKPLWRQNIEGWPKIDNTLSGTMAGYSVTGIVGGANFATGTAAATTSTGTISLTGMKPVFNSYFCEGGDITAASKCAMSATSTTSCTLNCTTTVTSGDKIWIKSGEGN